MKLKPRSYLIFILLILALGAVGYFKSVPGLNGQSGEAPRIEINPQLFDFGEVEYGQVAEYTFLVENTGKKVLKINRLSTSCSCTTAKISKEEINPGEEADLLVSYNTGAMSGPHGKGEQDRIIYVFSSDPVSPQVEVMIKAYVR